jgi:acetyl-CoA carboxylase carboxyltransferase component/biotin carboxyl carrier protein
MMIKAVAGGGGRGMRAVHRADEVEAAFERCRSEAQQAFGEGAVYVERLVPAARHVEVQVVGDGTGAVAHLGTRECSLQRNHQKLVEVAPALPLPPGMEDRLLADAVALAAEVRFLGVGTVELLVDATADDERAYAFLEVNARLQVEHTVTEEVTGVDLVQTQLHLAAGNDLAGAGLDPEVPVPARGLALQARVNMETMAADGAVRPSGGTLTAFDLPSGPGVRVDTFGYTGYSPSPRFDSLLAKVIVHAPSGSLTEALTRSRRALRELRADGVDTNVGFLGRLLAHPEVAAGRWTTALVGDHVADLAAAGDGPAALFFDDADPGAVGAGGAHAEVPEGVDAVASPVVGVVVAVDVAEGDVVPAGHQLVVLEAMKMEHVVVAPTGGGVRQVAVVPGDTVREGQPLVLLAGSEAKDEAVAEAAEDDVDPDHVRPDLAEVLERHALGHDAARPDAVERRRRTGHRTTRENITDLCDDGSFVEYAPLVIAAQRRRREVQDLIERTPADGLVAGIGSVNADLVGPERSRCVVTSYDYTVLAGTQGFQNHRKKDRMFELAERQRLPVVLFAEGGGGRPGDTDAPGVAGLDCMAFHLFGRLSGLVPLVGITTGRCFAGNAALLGSCDVVIATEGSNIGMGGPAMIEGGGLGVFRPEEVGPMDVQVPNGVVDIAVADEAEAVAAAKRYLSYFQGPVAGWECADQRLLRSAIPENRLRIYDVRSVIETMVDTGSVLELRAGFGPGMVTALARVEGRPIGVIANNPSHLAGAIDREGADKAARFMQLCDAFDLPILFLCDTPGIMVGPESEATALVRHCSRLFVIGANLTVPFFTIVLRKAYGLGAQTMAGGSFKAPLFTISWPTGEFGGMGLEGAVQLGFRKELEAVADPEERKALFGEMVARMYEHGKALNTASHFEIDDVIDPVDSRRWITTALATAPGPLPRSGKKRPNVDTW